MPYALPIASIFIIAGFLISNPSITGFAVRENDYNMMIKISTYDFAVVPEDSVVQVSINDISSQKTFKEFIELSKGEYELIDGKFENINYEGMGYSGNHDYFLPISEFGFDNLKRGDLVNIKVYYENYLISESSVPIK